jgi:predicted NAD/FAD-binding protein
VDNKLNILFSVASFLKKKKFTSDARGDYIFPVCMAVMVRGLSMAMAFDATVNNISVISWQLVLLLEETGVPAENHRPAGSR